MRNMIQTQDNKESLEELFGMVEDKVKVQEKEINCTETDTNQIGSATENSNKEDINVNKAPANLKVKESSKSSDVRNINPKKVQPVENGQINKSIEEQIDRQQSAENKHITKEKNFNKDDKNVTGNHPKKSIAETLIDRVNKDDQIDKIIGKTYKLLKHKIIMNEGEEKKTKKRKPNKVKTGASQEMIPIASINNGIIKTTSGMYVKILEILPINFAELTVNKRADIARTFSSIFRDGPSRLHFKCISDKSNPERIINFIKQKCEEEKWQRGISENVLECAQDIIDKIIRTSDENTLSKRYFVIYRYEGNSSDIKEIMFEMDTIKESIKNIFKNSGNYIIDYGIESETMECAEILYYFFNRNTCRTESLRQRIERINQDLNIYNMTSGEKPKESLDVDYIAPKGIYFVNRKYLYTDGKFKTFLTLKENGHPLYPEIGWLDNLLLLGEGTEIDIHTVKLPHQTTLDIINQFVRWGRVSARQKVNNQEKREEIISKTQNKAYIADRMNSGEDLFYTMIIITLSADSFDELRKLEAVSIKKLNSQLKLSIEDTYANCRDYYYATLPLMELPIKIFNRNKRNYLTSSLESLYFFTSEELTDPTGFVLGENARVNNKSLVAINNFNTDYFTNGNISIFGMSGSGKTYSMQIIARAMRIIGTRVFMILPIKAHEYLRGCKAIDGEYITIGPGSRNIINICEIIEEQNIDKQKIVDKDMAEKSLLAKKIASILTWIRINMAAAGENMTAEESDIAEVQLKLLYKDFGITDNNESIYNEDGTKKIMPIIGDIYDRFMEFTELTNVCRNLKKYISGSCQNMNGQTNIDLTNKFICFDVDKDRMSEELLAPYLYIVTDCVYSLVKQNRYYKDVVFLDEVWNLIKIEAAAKIIYDMVKVIRGYSGAVIPTTQDINDYISNEYGRAIISNTSIKLIMYLEPTECKRVAQELNLTEEDIENITSFGRGQALLLSSNIKTYINIIPSSKEDREFTTDPNRLRMYAEMDASKSN